MGPIALPRASPPTGSWTEDAPRPAEDMLVEEAVVLEQDGIVESMMDQERLDMINVRCAGGRRDAMAIMIRLRKAIGAPFLDNLTQIIDNPGQIMYNPIQIIHNPEFFPIIHDTDFVPITHNWTRRFPEYT
jgi:hypothetical protein